MTSIIITAVVIFLVTSLWSKYAYTKGNKNLYVSFEALSNELDMLSQKLGYENIYDYWIKNQGREYAEKGKLNIENALKFLREG